MPPGKKGSGMSFRFHDSEKGFPEQRSGAFRYKNAAAFAVLWSCIAQGVTYTATITDLFCLSS
jgi:hypothetical protein